MLWQRGVALAVAAGTKVMTVAQWALNLAMSANPVSLIVLGVAALGAGLVWLYNNCEPVREMLDTMWDVCLVQLKVVWSFVQLLWSGIKKVASWLGLGGPEELAATVEEKKALADSIATEPAPKSPDKKAARPASPQPQWQMIPGVPSDMNQMMPQSMPPGMAPGMTLGMVPQGMPSGMMPGMFPGAMPPGTNPETIPQGVPPGMMPNLSPEIILQNMPADMGQMMPQGMPPGMPWEVSLQGTPPDKSKWSSPAVAAKGVLPASEKSPAKPEKSPVKQPASNTSSQHIERYQQMQRNLASNPPGSPNAGVPVTTTNQFNIQATYQVNAEIKELRREVMEALRASKSELEALLGGLLKDKARVAYE